MKYKSNPQPVPSLPSWIPSPSGVSGTTLPDDLTEDEIALAHVQSWPKAGIPDSGAHLDSPVKDTPAGFVGVLIAPDGTRHFSCYDTPGMTLERTGAMEFTSREAAEKACLFRLGKGDAFWNSERSARQSMAKEMMGWTYVVESAAAPASPVDSVGVPDWKIHSVHSHVIVRTPDVNGGNVHVATFSNEDDARIAVQAVSSHAAKDAKIKELSLRMELLIMRMESEMSRFPKEEKRNRKGFMDRGRAALALPCA